MQAHWEKLFRQRMSEPEAALDPAHDVLHIERVVAMAKSLAESEGACLDVVVPAAWLHDFIVVRKDDPRRSQASRLSALAAINWLRTIGYPEQYFSGIAHAIEAHSFSANIECRSLEAKVVQDADRLDGVGAIGIARLFVTAGLMRRALYAVDDPFCTERAPDDLNYTIDHVYRKLFVVCDSLKTTAGQAEGAKRKRVLETYLLDFSRELGTPAPTD
jgi:uncharacterized protein